jgi:1-acyl-sn-glycerol-3-phosphate acyltransferase
VTLPALVLIAGVWIAALPVTLLVAAAVDLVRGGPWPLVRCVLYLALYLCCELLGVLGAFVVWLASGVWAGGSRARFLRWNVRLQVRWATALYRGAERLFNFRTEVEGDGEIPPGPVIVFVRHVSQADTLIPVIYVTGTHGIALRFVLKQELLWDPCLDVVGNRLPNAFVRRGSGESAREVDAVQRLMDDLGSRDGVLIYPEGTRFTPSKRARIVERLADHPDPRIVERARRLRHVLPPHPGGALGLLERNRDADVVLCAHAGLESAGSPRDILTGKLVGATVRVRFWRVPRSGIPRTREDRLVWLYEQWQRVDEWLGTVYPRSG